MRKVPRFQFSTIRGFLSKLPGFSNPEKHSLHFLNSTQFLGALNDNIYKLVLIFYLIQIKGPEHANAILSIAGAIFVIPFLLFSSTAGILADRFSKSRLVMIVKAAEIVIMVFAILAFAFKFTWSSYALLFLLSAQSAMFGPSKYGIIPELVEKQKIPKANGLITSFTYFAIIAGTFLASFLTEITDHNYILVGFFCLLIAIIGFLSSFGIKYTPAKGTKKKINIYFVRQIFHTLIECKDQKHLIVCISTSAYFLFVGAFTQLNIIPFAMQSLGLTEIAGGYLFLTTALGIAAGALAAGRASRSRIELGLTCLSGLLIAIFFFFLSASTFQLPIAITSLFLIGFSGGCFVVPIDAFIQLFSPEANRGHVIAASNFLSFIGVLFASLFLYLFNQVLEFSSAGSFAVMGWITLFFSLFLIIRLSDLFLSYTGRKILRVFMPVEVENFELVEKTNRPILMLEEGSFLKAWLLCSFIPNLNILVPQYKTRRFPWFQHFFYSLHRIDSPQKFETLVEKSKQFSDHETIPCIYLLKKKPIPEKQPFTLPPVFIRKQFEVISVNFEKKPGSKTTTILFSK